MSRVLKQYSPFDRTKSLGCAIEPKARLHIASRSAVLCIDISCFHVIQLQAVQQIPRFPPIRHILIHDRHKILAVVPHSQVRQLMKNHIFQAFDRFPGQLEIQPYFAGICVASTPTGGHVLGLPRSTVQPRDVFHLGRYISIFSFSRARYHSLTKASR